MKKIIIVFYLLIVSMSLMAQKSYVIIRQSSFNLYIGGDIPEGVNKSYGSSSNGDLTKNIGEVLNLLAKKGYVVESMAADIFLLSKNTSGSSSYSYVRQTIADNEDVKEIARYNLQGMPVHEYDKGIQIVVYSNYTTKTVIVE